MNAEVRTNGNGSETAATATRLQLCEQQLREQGEQLAQVRRTVKVLVAALKCATATLEG